MFYDAVFEGGGVKGIGIVGALCFLEEMGYKIKRAAGTSAGAIIAALLSAGYTPYELKKVLNELDFTKVCNKDFIQSIPYIGKILGLIFEKGIYSCDAFEKMINDLLRAKGKTKFRDVFEDGEFRLKIIATDVTEKKILILPDGLKDYGIDPMDFDIAKAVRMSISIPFYFKPVKLNYNGKTSLIIDGGIMSNFPVWIFDSEDIPRWPTFGFKLVEPDLRGEKTRKSNIISYAFTIITTMIEENDLIYIRNKDFARTITIPTQGIKTTEFNLPLDKKIKLFNSGYTSAKRFMESWDFRRYIEKFRISQPPSRRDMLFS